MEGCGYNRAVGVAHLYTKDSIKEEKDEIIKQVE